MKRTQLILSGLLVAFATVLATPGWAQEAEPLQKIEREDRDYDRDEDRGRDRGRIDRYLDVEVWTNHEDGEFYEGDNITISFRANRDCFVAIYSVDTRGRVNLLFPENRRSDNFVIGGQTNRLPDGSSDYDYVVSGPDGVEHIQVIASRDRFPIPDWYPNSGIVSDWDDRADFMDYINNRYFVRYDGQRFAFDRTSIYVSEWEPQYFRPVWYDPYPAWSVCGNVYIDYPFGSSVYINGRYWGCAPLYVPRLIVGWHTITVYDPWGHCWEDDLHITHRSTIVLDRTIIRTRPSFVSKYKEVRLSGYRDPIRNGYPDFAAKKETILRKSGVVTPLTSEKGKIRSEKSTAQYDSPMPKLTKKYMYGEAKLVKTDRGLDDVSPIRESESALERKRDRGRNVGGLRQDATSSRERKSSGLGERVLEENKSEPATGREDEQYYQRKTEERSSGRHGSFIQREREPVKSEKQAEQREAEKKESAPSKVQEQPKSGKGKSSAAPQKTETKKEKSTKSSDDRPKGSGKGGR
jgi:Domain of unknown function (DUF4384)/PEGA domain